LSATNYLYLRLPRRCTRHLRRCPDWDPRVCPRGTAHYREMPELEDLINTIFYIRTTPRAGDSPSLSIPSACPIRQEDSTFGKHARWDPWPTYEDSLVKIANPRSLEGPYLVTW